MTPELTYEDLEVQERNQEGYGCAPATHRPGDCILYITVATFSTCNVLY